MRIPILRAALAACFLLLAAAPRAGAAPDAITVDGGRYYGPLVDGKLHGRGRIEWENGTVYEGDLAKGLMSGKGRMRSANGDSYEGEWRDGMMSGVGRFEVPEREVYEGHFRLDRYWGQGELRHRDGRIYRGEFVRGDFQGKGRLENPDGSRYEGEFKDWRFHGKGRLRLANGDVYEGGFADGFFEGQGTLTYAKARPDGRRQESGLWRYGSLPQDAERKQAKANVELALYAQKELLDKALAALQPREPGRINLYLLAVAGDGSQEVFRREVDFVQAEFARRFGTAGRSVALVNSRNTLAQAPMATLTSIRRSLNAIAARMDRNEDILFLFLTSHGSAEHELSLSQNGIDLQDLRAAELGAALKESGIRWKVVVVSACYSGGFIEPLQDERTLVMTAARRDRRSFGCADENDFTYFGRAFFKESLPKSRSFVEAFRRAEALVEEWERKETKNIDENRSLPQISNAAAIDAQLKRWWSQSPR